MDTKPILLRLQKLVKGLGALVVMKIKSKVQQQNLGLKLSTKTGLTITEQGLLNLRNVDTSGVAQVHDILKPRNIAFECRQCKRENNQKEASLADMVLLRDSTKKSLVRVTKIISFIVLMLAGMNNFASQHTSVETILNVIRVSTKGQKSNGIVWL